MQEWKRNRSTRVSKGRDGMGLERKQSLVVLIALRRVRTSLLGWGEMMEIICTCIIWGALWNRWEEEA